MIFACAVALLSAGCGPTAGGEPVTVSWSVAGLPPAYVERRWRAQVPPSLREAFDAVVAKARFFDLPADFGANPDARDAGTYTITIAAGSRTHTVRFSDTNQTEELAALRNWIVEELLPVATPD